MKKITIEIKAESHTEIVLINKRGDTFTFNPTTRNGESLLDFLTLSENE